MKKVLWVSVVCIIVSGVIVACTQLWPGLAPQSMSLEAFDRAAFVDQVRTTFLQASKYLAETTGDELDFDRLRFFTGTDLNGEDETVVIIPLTKDSPSCQLALLTEAEAPLAEIGPLPYAGFLPLDPCTCFHTLVNGTPYLCRVLNYGEAEIVDQAGKRIRMATTFSWNRGGDEPEWFKYLGNTVWHFYECITTGVNQS